MKNYDVRWRPQARGDLLALYEWIADQADPDTAYEYVSKIEAHATALATYPERGTARGDFAPAVRTIPYRRRMAIAYRVMDDMVEFLPLPI